ncbi:hypothetical protein KC926_00315, partial [Candidatus Kaiserbacteria bacterium]|nr:hypothetical protein [Candidatus Kaiserbacteria bacterium]
EANTITVDQTKPALPASSSTKISNYILREELTIGDTVELQIRYRQEPFRATILSLDKNGIEFTSTEATEKPAVGQSVVIYRKSLCLGGGIVEQ